MGRRRITKSSNTSRKRTRENSPPEIDSVNVTAEEGEEGNEEMYEIETLLHFRVVKKKGKSLLNYEIKWKDYDSDENTFEEENRILNFAGVYRFWVRQLESNSLPNNKRYLATGTILYNSIQNTFGRFLLGQHVDLRQQLLDLVPTYHWQYRLHCIEDEDDFRVAQSRYNHQLRRIYEGLDDYPLFEMVNLVDQYLPIPLSHVCFNDIYPDSEDIFYEEIADSKNMHILSKTGLQIVTDRTKGYVPKDEVYEIFATNLYDVKTSLFIKAHPDVHCLVQRSIENTWELLSRKDIPSGVKIMPISGKVTDIETALCSLNEENLLLAYTSFIRIDDKTCLDRRSLSDFSQYLAQSCEPNCYAVQQFIENRTRLFIYSKRHISAGEKLTLDWFKMFKTSRNTPSHQDLVEKGVLHVLCSCAKPECRSVLWYDERKSIASRKKADPYGGLLIY